MSQKPLPPGPSGTWLAGNLGEMSRDWLGTYTRYARTFGDVVAYRLGPVRSVLVSDPTLAEELVVRQAAKLKKSSIQQLIRPLIGQGIFLSEGDTWKTQRRLVSPPFHRQHIAGYGESMVGAAERLVAEFRDGETRDVHRDMTQLALRIVSSTLFAAEAFDDLLEVERILANAIVALTARLDTLFPLPNWVPTAPVRRLREARRELDRLIDRLIARRRAAPHRDGRDVLSLLIAARDADTGLGLSDCEVRDEAVTIFVAGFETTAISLTWAFYLLANHCDVIQRLHSELDHVLHDRAPGVEDIPKLAWTEQIAKETLRLYPPAWIMGREATEELELGGFRVPRGFTVEISQWVLHRDPRWWTEPERFDPSRWASGLVDRLPRFAYLPFGGGPRVCIGRAFAMMEIVLVIASLARRVDFEPVEGPALVPDPGFTLRPASQLRLRVRRRAQKTVTPD